MSELRAQVEARREGWLQPLLTRGQAEALLLARAPGAFVIRKSRKPDQLAISIRCDDDPPNTYKRREKQGSTEFK